MSDVNVLEVVTDKMQSVYGVEQVESRNMASRGVEVKATFQTKFQKRFFVQDMLANDMDFMVEGSTVTAKVHDVYDMMRKEFADL